MRKKNTLKKQRTSWTRDDVKVLRRYFRATSNAAVALELQRTPKAVERKASRLSLYKFKKYLRTLGRRV